jgi:hypothetical protein
VLIAGLVVINMSGMFANLVAAHVGDRDRAQGLVGVQQNSIDAKIEQQRHVVADLDRRIGQIDSAIEAASTRGRTVTALNAIQDQRRARQAIVDERKKEAGTLTALQAEHASVVARGRQIEGENAPIKFIAQTLDTDTEHAVRLLIALVVLCTDLLSLSIAAAVSARR